MPPSSAAKKSSTGDSAVNVQSRVQMDLFKAKRRARTLYYPKHSVAGTAAKHLLELAA